MTLAGSATNAPETGGRNHGWQRGQQVKWTSTATNKLLLEAGIGTYLSDWNTRERPGNLTRDLVRVVEQCSAGCAANGNIPGLTYRSQTTDLFSDGRNKNVTTTWRASVSFVSGSKSLKIGYQGSLLGDIRSANRGANDLRYRVNNGVANQFTMFIHEFQNDLWMRDDGFYANGQWTMNKLTLQGGLRFDRAWSYSPDQTIGVTNFLASPLSFARADGVNYKDISPRMGVAWDVFGNGKTAVKVNAGRYEDQIGRAHV